MRNQSITLGRLIAVLVYSVMNILRLTVGHAPTVVHVESPLGGFLLSPDQMFASEEAKGNITVRNVCACRMACWSAYWCIAASGILRSDGKYDCLLADHRPLNISSKSNSVYILSWNTVAKKLVRFTDNKELYIVPDMTLGFLEARSFCRTLPGFRLGVFVTEAETNLLVEYLKQLGEPNLYIDLVKSPEGLVWGDGTLLQETYSSQLYLASEDSGNLTSEPYLRLNNVENRFWDTMFGIYYFICQAYLF